MTIDPPPLPSWVTAPPQKADPHSCGYDCPGSASIVLKDAFEGTAFEDLLWSCDAAD